MYVIYEFDDAVDICIHFFLLKYIHTYMILQFLYLKFPDIRNQFISEHVRAFLLCPRFYSFIKTGRE